MYIQHYNDIAISYAEHDNPSKRWQAAISADLAQLLSAASAVRSAGMSTLQQQFNHVQTIRPELSILQWRSPQLHLNSVNDTGLKTLLSGDTVRIKCISINHASSLSE